MAETDYQFLWNYHEKIAQQSFGIELSVGANREDWNNAARRTLTAFLADLYAEYWRPTYTLLGLDMPDTLSVLQARATEVHHWQPSITSGMSKEELFKALANDFNHCRLPARAVRLAEFGLGNLPERQDVIDRLQAQVDSQ